MNATLSRLTATAVRAAAALAAALTLASCGGGGVSANPSPIVDSPTLTILPATADMYSGLPTTFVFSGGTGAYIIASSNQAVIPLGGGVTGRSVTVVPNPVTADTVVTLTLRDTGTAAPVSATVTVHPGTLNNDLTITPNPLQAASCSPALCSGTEAEVKVSLAQGGIPLAARGVKFRVVTGAFTFIESPPLIYRDLSDAIPNVITATDETGMARVRLRVTAGAPNQTAQVEVVDMVTGAFRRATFAIAQYNGNTPAFFTLPSSVTLTGPTTAECSTGTADVSVFGGTPPYTLAGGSPSTFTISVDGVAAPPAIVASSGGKFRISFASTRACVENAPIAVTDAAGVTTTVTVTNKFGTVAPPITLIPNPVSLRCDTSATLAIVGGAEPFAAGSSSGLLLVLPPAGRIVTMNAATSGMFVVPFSGTVTVSVTDGTNTANAEARLTCP